MVFLMIYVVIGAIVAFISGTGLDKVGEEQFHSDMITVCGFTSVVADRATTLCYRHRFQMLAYINVVWPALIAIIIRGIIVKLKSKR